VAVIQDGTVGSTLAKVEVSSLGLRAIAASKGVVQYSVSGPTGTIAAAAAARAPVFAMRMDPSAGAARTPAKIQRVRVHYSTIVAYTTPLTPGRSIALYRATSGTPAGGTNIATVAKKDSPYGSSEFETAGGGLIQIATTAALTGLTLDNNPIRAFSLLGFGAAGATVPEVVWEFGAFDSSELIIRPGESLVLGVGIAAMDAAGTWSAFINVDWVEGE
jgi:hypothetical protein